MRHSGSLRILEAAATLLFLVQAVRVLFSVLFGLIYDTIFSETVTFGTLGVIMLCVFAAFLTPLAAPRQSSRPMLFAGALVAALARIPLTVNVPAVRLWSGILVVAAAGIYTTALLRGQPRVFSTGLLLAFTADQFLRAAGNTYDVGLRAWWLPAQGVLSLGACVAACLVYARRQAVPPAEGSIGLAAGLAIGALLFLETSLLGFPNALARWSQVDYAVAAPLLMAVTLLPIMPAVQRSAQRLLRGPLGGLGMLFLSLAGLAAGRIVGGAVGLAGTLVVQFLLLLVPSGLVRARRREHSGLVLAAGFILFLVVNFAYAFTFTYPYTIPAFRGLGLPIALVAAATAALPSLHRPTSIQPPTSGFQLPAIWQWLFAALVVLLTAACAWSPAPGLKEAGPIRAGTYNMHYGYNTSWQFKLEEIARTIEESGADIVLLQEVDTCRITSYGVDDALWLARQLRMQEVYGPALEELSGIALLTRFPIVQGDTQPLTSQLEQTAIVHARVRVGERPLDAYGVWLGLEPEERARQLGDALSIIGEASPAVLGGDLNSTPDSVTYARIHAAGFDDPFTVGGFDPALTSPAIEPVERIDFVWVRGLEVRDARVLDSLASDHRMVVVELALPSTTTF